ncbi:MAG: hypothetical protein F6J86_24440 [Symploca sp. SIO1B1]|nr:hypothetical protein [Symploca sp. SIO1B1]
MKNLIAAFGLLLSTKMAYANPVSTDAIACSTEALFITINSREAVIERDEAKTMRANQWSVTGFEAKINGQKVWVLAKFPDASYVYQVNGTANYFWRMQDGFDVTLSCEYFD